MVASNQPICPLPEVADALDPYIRPRQEVDAIRTQLQSHLEEEISKIAKGGSAVPLSLVTLHRPGIVVDPGADISPKLTGVRRAYIEALQAHSAAQARYDALKADLEKTRESAMSSEAPGTNDMFKEYLMPLLRERERNRRLKVIERAYNEIHAMSEGLSALSIDQIASRDNGEPPVQPLTDTSSPSHGKGVESRIAELKKAILVAKHGAEFPQPMKPSTRPSASKSPQVLGLQDALNELTSWMENQLVLIGSGDEDAAEIGSPAPNGNQTAPSHFETPASKADSNTSEVPSTGQIQDLYAEYISAREKLINVIRDPPKPDLAEASRGLSALRPRVNMAAHKRTGSLASVLANKDASSDEASASSSEILLPYLPALIAAKQQDEAQTQQSAHLRRQIARAESEMARVLGRLADESHLVAPGATRASDWAEASDRANEELDGLVSERIEAGQASIKVARQALANIQQTPDLLSGLKK